MNNKLIEVVNRYLEQEKTDFAIMITGPWGCGKSYYVDHSLTDYIEKIDSHFEVKGKFGIGRVKEKYKVKKISLYGIKSESDIFFKIWSDKKLLTSAYKIAGDFVRDKYSVSISDLFYLIAENTTKDQVFIFDDLERVEDSLLEMSLAVIDTISKKNKTIIVCNEDEIRNKNNYLQIKEKTVRFTTEFSPSFDEMFDNIIDNDYNINNYDCIKNYKYHIVSIFKNASCRNLRTLKFFLDILSTILDIIREDDQITEKEEMRIKFLISLLIISIEHKEGNSKDDILSLNDLKTHLSISSLFPNEALPTDKDIYIEKSYAKYSSVMNDIHITEELIEYVLHGNIDKKCLYTLNDELIKQKGTPEGRLLRKFNEYDVSNNDIDAIINFIKDDKYNMYELMVLYSRFINIDALQIEYSPQHTLDEIFMNAIDKASKNHQYDFAFPERVPIWKESNDSYFKRYDYMYRYAIELNNQCKNKVIQNEDLVISIKKNDDKYISNKALLSAWETLVETSNLNGLDDALSSCNVATKKSFAHLVQAAFAKGGFQLNDKSVSVIDSIKDAISNTIGGKPYSLDKAWLIITFNYLNNINHE